MSESKDTEKVLDDSQETPEIPEELDGQVIPFYKAETGITTPNTYFIYGMTIGVIIGALLLFMFNSKLLLCIATFLGMLIGYLIKKPEDRTAEKASEDSEDTKEPEV